MQQAPILTAILFLEATLYAFIPLLFKPMFITRELQGFIDKEVLSSNSTGVALFWKLFLYHNLIISPAFPNQKANVKEIFEMSYFTKFSSCFLHFPERILDLVTSIFIWSVHFARLLLSITNVSQN